MYAISAYRAWYLCGVLVTKSIFASSSPIRPGRASLRCSGFHTAIALLAPSPPLPTRILCPFQTRRAYPSCACIPPRGHSPTNPQKTRDVSLSGVTNGGVVRWEYLFGQKSSSHRGVYSTGHCNDDFETIYSDPSLKANGDSRNIPRSPFFGPYSPTSSGVEYHLWGANEFVRQPNVLLLHKARRSMSWKQKFCGNASSSIPRDRLSNRKY